MTKEPEIMTTKHSNWDHAPDEMTFKFLKSYKADNTLVFTRMAGSNGRPAYGMPKLMSRDNPEVPPGLLESEWYVKTLQDAEEKDKRGMRVRGENETEAARILAQYAQDTMISI